MPAGLSAADRPSSAQAGLFVAGAGEPLHRHPRANRECRLGEWLVGYEFQRSQRRTLGLSVGPQGLSVRAPRAMPFSEVDAFLQRKTAWVLSKLQQLRQASPLAPAATEWRAGACLPYLGRSLELAIEPGLRLRAAGASLDGGRLLLALPSTAEPERVRELAQAWLMREARRVFTERLDHFAPRLGVRYSSLRLSSATTRWGSASSNGSIRLNWRLIHLSLEMIDYVAAHELSHLREMNHGPDFWGVVASVMPDYDRRRRALRQIRLAAAEPLPLAP
jgi:predicted metal-dependent hydrolase